MRRGRRTDLAFRLLAASALALYASPVEAAEDAVEPDAPWTVADPPRRPAPAHSASTIVAERKLPGTPKGFNLAFGRLTIWFESRAWQLDAEGRLRHSVPVPEGARPAVLYADGRLLAVVGESEIGFLAKEGQPAPRICVPGRIRSLLVSRDGARVVVGNSDGQVICCASSGRRLWTTKIGRGVVSALDSIEREGTTAGFVAGTWERTVVWLDAGGEVRHRSAAAEKLPDGLSVSPDGDRVGVALVPDESQRGDERGSVALYDDRARELARVQAPGRVRRVIVGRAGALAIQLLRGGEKWVGIVQVGDDGVVHSGTRRPRLVRGGLLGYWPAAGAFLVEHDGGAYRVAASGEMSAFLEPSGMGERAWTFLPDAGILVTVDRKGILRLRKLAATP